MTTYAALIVTCLLLRLSDATQVEICGGDMNAVVTISNCENPPCMLKRNTTVQMSIEMTPDEDVPEIRNSVHAIIAMPIPFLGVDNTDACPNMYTPDGTKVGCPLKKGQKYLYKNEFFILKGYPKMNVLVDWQLKTPEGEVKACFQVASKIRD